MARFHARTDVGLKRRQNEDALLALDQEGLYVVADGVGGRKAGELASAITVDTLQAYAGRLQAALAAYASDPIRDRRNDILQLLDEATNVASSRVFEAAKSTGREGMTSTMVAALVGAGAAFLVHVGDSRAYVLRDGQLRQLTEDHSLVNEMVRNGALTPEEASRSRYRNVITRAIGLYPQVQVDTLYLEILEGDRLLLCTDGLSDLVSTTDMSTLMRSSDVSAAVDALVDAALAAGGKDNISVIGIEPDASLDADAAAARAKVMEQLFLFSDLPYQARLRVSRVVSERTVSPGDQVVGQGEPGDTMYAVIQGSYSVRVDGQEVAVLKQGEHFGDLALADNQPRSASIVALTEGRLLAIERDALKAWCASEASMGNRILWKLVATLASRLRDANRRKA